MDYIKEIFNVGDDVLRTVTSAIENNDFSNLSADLKIRFGEFAEDVREDAQMRIGGTRARRSTYDRTTYWYDPDTGESGASRGNPPGSAQEQPRFSRTPAGTYPSRYSQRTQTPFRQKFFGKGGAIAKFISGIIGTACFLPVSIGMFIMMLMGDTSGLIAFFTMLPFTSGSLWLLVSGNQRRKLVDVYNRYAEIIGPAEYYSIEDLATYAGTSEEEAVRQIEKMMKSNMLPQGKFDQNQTTLMLTPRVWKQYQAAEKARRKRELEQEKGVDQEAAHAEASEGNTILEEGNAFIRKIRRYNDLIPDPEMSAKLSRLEGIMQRIFHQLEKDPDSAPDLHKLMNYYLPTVDKLVQAYTELDSHPAGSENIDRTRREIEEAVDTVNVAFENLFNDLFQDTAWDISSDISVMKTMMKQDGLMEKTH